MRRRFWRGSATLFGAVMLGLFAALFIASWHAAQAVLFQDERDRERGRMWGVTCLAAHRAVQAGLVTAERPVTLDELRRPALPFQPFLPAGMQPVGEAGLFAAGYGVILVDGVPMAACSLSGNGIAQRHAELRAGAVMGGVDVVGYVGGAETAMHAHLADVERVLGALAQGSLFVTADFGLAHPVERVHRRPVGGRPELAAMDLELVFDAGSSMVGVGTASVEGAEAGSGALPDAGNASVRGDVILRQDDPLLPAARLSIGAATSVRAAGGFAFGGTQAVFAIPGAFGIGTSMRSRGAVTVGSMTLSGNLEAGGNVVASGSVNGQAVESTGEASAVSGTVAGNLGVDSCDGCAAPLLGQ